MKLHQFIALWLGIIVLIAVLTGCNCNEAFQALDGAARAYYTPRPTPTPVYYAP
jgi:hypothetical protein